MLHRVHLAMSGTRNHNFSGIGTDCIGSWKSNYHTTTMASFKIGQMWKWIKTSSRIETKLYMVFPLQSWHFFLWIRNLKCLPLQENNSIGPYRENILKLVLFLNHYWLHCLTANLTRIILWSRSTKYSKPKMATTTGQKQSIWFNVNTDVWWKKGIAQKTESFTHFYKRNSCYNPIVQRSVTSGKITLQKVLLKKTW
jgi:hypothetical protein